MRYQPKQINCMRDHTLMQHSHIYPHTNKSNNWITQRCHSCCIVYRHLFLRLFFFFCWFYLQMLSRSQQACIWPAICFQPSHEASCHRRSLALSSTVHIRAHWGKCPARHNSVSVILQVSDAFLQLFPLRLPDNLATGWPQPGVCTSLVCSVLTDSSIL